MIIIRPIKPSEVPDVVRIKIESFTEELAGMAENTMSFEDELYYLTKWIGNSKEADDVRLFLGAFEDGELAGYISVCLAESQDIPREGIELNSLAVVKSHRGRRISLYLLLAAINYYVSLGAKKMVIYSHHYAPSNTFYQNLGARLLRQDKRRNGSLLVDVFIMDIIELQKQLEYKIRRKKACCR